MEAGDNRFIMPGTASSQQDSGGTQVATQLPVTGEMAASQMQPQSVGATMPVAGASPSNADDADLIEDEWVEAVKRVVTENRTDPYTLNKAMTRLRADYLKKRYNKDIEIPE